MGAGKGNGERGGGGVGGYRAATPNSRYVGFFLSPLSGSARFVAFMLGGVKGGRDGGESGESGGSGEREGERVMMGRGWVGRGED